MDRSAQRAVKLLTSFMHTGSAKPGPFTRGVYSDPQGYSVSGAEINHRASELITAAFSAGIGHELLQILEELPEVDCHFSDLDPQKCQICPCRSATSN